ncbi:MAG TPA: hypothetical protein VNO75_07435, partial [Gemmatimonadaceae bacterium]|nr:hypothetical protein [Gemmatimonadaceae bacterium]
MSNIIGLFDKLVQRPGNLFYFLLAAFSLSTVAASMYLGARIVNVYTASVGVNQDWANRSMRYRSIAALAARVNAPGNDVFLSRDIPREEARLDSALRSFNLAKHEARIELAGLKQRDMLAEDFDRLDAAMASMVSET